jgi:hypothetical protein
MFTTGEQTRGARARERAGLSVLVPHSTSIYTTTPGVQAGILEHSSQVDRIACGQLVRGPFVTKKTYSVGQHAGCNHRASG